MPDNLTNTAIGQEFRLIPLSGKHGKGKFAKVSPARFEYLSQFIWYLSTKRFYVARATTRNGKRLQIYMHREIAGFPEGMDVDHKNGDHLNNTDGNLRIATRSQNNANNHNVRKGTSSRFRGVCLDWRSGKWLAQITYEKRNIRLGIFESEEDAARARDGAAIALHGEFASLVVPHLQPIPYSPPKPQKRTSQFKGVGWSMAKRKWRAYRSEGKRMIHIGYFEKEIEAYEAVKVYY